MHVFRLTLILVACFALAQPLKAQVYKTVDKHGNVVFSDKPSSGSKKVNVGPVQTYNAPKPATPESKTGTSASTGTATADTGTARTPPQPGAAPAPEKPKIPKRYKLAITSPKHDSVVRQNAGNLSVSARIKPPLHASDRVQFLMNGQPVGTPGASLSTTIPFVDRGTHSIGAKVLGSGGQVKGRAQAVTVHLKRFSINN